MIGNTVVRNEERDKRLNHRSALNTGINFLKAQAVCSQALQFVLDNSPVLCPDRLDENQSRMADAKIQEQFPRRHPRQDD
jgi:hypothetical protein